MIKKGQGRSLHYAQNIFIKQFCGNRRSSLNLKNLSIGMTHDYDKAILHGSTYLRLGTAIFGKRKFNQ